MIPLTSKESKSYEIQIYVIYAKKDLVLIKMHFKYTKESEIVAITPENLEELLILFAI